LVGQQIKKALDSSLPQKDVGKTNKLEGIVPYLIQSRHSFDWKTISRES
jgi:hypothetical protein